MKVKYVLGVVILSLTLIGCQMEDNTNKLVFTGTVEANEINICAEVAGVIEDIFIEEGEVIKKGDKIAKIDTTKIELQIKEANAGLKASEAKLRELKSGARNEEIDRVKSEMENAKIIYEGAKKNHEYRLKNLNDIKELYNTGAATEKQVEDAKALLDTAYTNMESTKKKYDSVRAQLNLLLNGATNESIQIAEAEIEKANARIQLLEYQK